MEAGRAAELAARASYGRLVALLAARSGELAAAEDALGDAFRAALAHWPVDGVPERPEAWLLAAAKRRLVDRARHNGVQAAAAQTIRLVAEEAQARADDGATLPDKRLELLFVCAHPAIEAGARTPLMLQLVLGLDPARIASAFLVTPSTMGQRLVRAKARIRADGLAFAVPEPEAWPQRVEAVLDAIYAAYGAGWDDVTGADPRRRGLADEALWLARLVAGLLPEQAEAHGLLALILHCEARRAARRGPDGRYMPLSEQDTSLWSQTLIAEAERALAAAAKQGRIGRFQLEAAIQSAHVQRGRGARVDADAVALLYEGLVARAPTAGALVGRAAALAEARGPAVGFAALGALAPEPVATYQPYWAVRTDLLARLGRVAEADAVFTRAIGLSEDAAVRAFLETRRRQLP